MRLLRDLPSPVVLGLLLLPAMLLLCIFGIGVGLLTVSVADQFTMNPSFQIARTAFIIAVLDASAIAYYWFKIRK